MWICALCQPPQCYSNYCTSPDHLAPDGHSSPARSGRATPTKPACAGCCT